MQTEVTLLIGEVMSPHLSHVIGPNWLINPRWIDYIYVSLAFYYYCYYHHYSVQLHLFFFSSFLFSDNLGTVVGWSSLVSRHTFAQLYFLFTRPCYLNCQDMTSLREFTVHDPNIRLFKNLNLKVPQTNTDQDRPGFWSYAPCYWNELQWNVIMWRKWWWVELHRETSQLEEISDKRNGR